MKTSLLDCLRDLLTTAALALADPRPRRKFVHLGLGLLCGQKPKTITSALEWLDQRQEDWSADYRLFSQAHWEAQAAFAPVLTQALSHSSCGTQRVYFGQDDTLLRKASRKIPGTTYARDPLTRMLHKPVEQMGGRGVRKLENSELYDNQLRRPEPNRL